jgi:hypothetical protein
MPNIVVSVPGPWVSREAAIAAMHAVHHREYLYAGVICIESSTKMNANVEMRTKDPRLLETITVAGRGRVAREWLAAVALHHFSAVISVADCSPEGCHLAARIARAFLQAGGVAVHVESAGIAHDPPTWSKLTAACKRLDDLYDLFIALVENDDNYQTCGMQNYGLPDAVMAKSVADATAAKTLRTFNRYQIIDRPPLRDGERFAISATAPRYRLARRPSTGYGPESPMHNPAGLWRLEPV